MLDHAAVLDRAVVLDELLGAAEIVLGLGDRAGHDADMDLVLAEGPAGGAERHGRKQCPYSIFHDFSLWKRHLVEVDG